MSALQWIIKEAKSLRAKNPKMIWKKAVAQASAIYASKHKGKSPVGKKKAVKKVAKKKAIKRTATKKIGSKLVLKKNEQRLGLTVKKAAKKKAVKKTAKKVSSLHTDTKSHNVNIRVMSGVNKSVMEDLEHTVKRIQQLENNIHNYNTTLLRKDINPSFKKAIKNDLKSFKLQVKEKKTHLRELKKLLK